MTTCLRLASLALAVVLGLLLSGPVRAAEEPRPSLELTFVGDVIFGSYRQHGYRPFYRAGDNPLSAVAPLLRADLAVANLETPLIDEDEMPPESPVRTPFRFGAPAGSAALLRAAGITAVSLANNHAYDLGLAGLLRTPAILRQAGVTPLGAATLPQALRVETIEAAGWRVGFVAVSTHRNVHPRRGEPLLPYAQTHELPLRLGPVLREARARHDLLAVVVHWGQEYEDGPSGSQRRAAHALIDAGADLVIGHHPHVLQGIERHGRGLIAYSLGNFVFPSAAQIPRQTGVLRLRYLRDGRCLERAAFHPVLIQGRPLLRPVPARGKHAERVRVRLRALSAGLDTAWEEDGPDLIARDAACAAPAVALSGRE